MSNVGGLIVVNSNPQQAEDQMIREKKLASPLKYTSFIGDNNDDIPQQMTEEQKHQLITLESIGVRFDNVLTNDP